MALVHIVRMPPGMHKSTKVQRVGSANSQVKLPLTKVQLLIHLFCEDKISLTLSHAACSSQHYVKQQAQCVVRHHLLSALAAYVTLVGLCMETA